MSRTFVASLVAVGVAGTVSLVGVLGNTTAGSGPSPYRSAGLLANARFLRCKLGAGTVTEWRDKTPTSSPAVFATDVSEAVVVFDQIDASKRTARVVGNIGSDPATLHVTPTSLSLVTEAGGGIVVYTVFGFQDGDGDFPMVTSRHLAIGTPTPQQYFGTCRVGS